MNKVIRENLPEPIGYYESQGLTFQQPRGKWRNVVCFNCASNGMRINTETGGFVCMAACGARGGNVLDYHRAAHGLGFVEAAKALGAYQDDGKPYTGPTRPTAIPARDLLKLAKADLYFCAQIVSAVRYVLNQYPLFFIEELDGRLTDDDLDGYFSAAGRVIHIAEVANV